MAPKAFPEIAAVEEADRGDSPEGFDKVQDYLARFGYLQPESAETGALDDPTAGALLAYQAFQGLPQTGVFDDATREQMTRPRCGLPDPAGELDFSVRCAWQRGGLTYAFGPGTADVAGGAEFAAFRRALATWSAAVPLTFTEVGLGQAHDVEIDWRAATDPDHSMVGGVLAHADFPPDCGIITSTLPKPVHFDDSEHTWSDGAVAGEFDVETVALHEFGHILGLQHSSVGGSVMFPTVSANHTLRQLTQDDRDGIRRLYRAGGAVTAWGENRLDIFGLGLDGSMFHKAWTGAAWSPSAMAWGSLGGLFTSAPAVTSWGDSRLDVFALGLDGSMFHKAWTGAAWSPSQTGWEALGGGFTSPPAVVAWGEDRLDIFALGLDGSMFHKAWTGAAWSPSQHGWEALGGRFTSPPAVASWGEDRLDIFGLGLDGQMFHKAWTGSAWSPSQTGWEALGGRFASAPAVTAWGDNRLDVFGLGLDGSMFHKAWTGTAWSPSQTGWEALGGRFASPPAVTSWGEDRLDIFGLGLDGQMFHKAWTGAAWSPSQTGWEALGGRFTSPPAVTSWGRDRLDVFGLGLDGSMFHKAWTGAAWSPSQTGWEALGGLFL